MGFNPFDKRSWDNIGHQVQQGVDPNQIINPIRDQVNHIGNQFNDQINHVKGDISTINDHFNSLSTTVNNTANTIGDLSTKVKNIPDEIKELTTKTINEIKFATTTTIFKSGQHLAKEKLTKLEGRDDLVGFLPSPDLEVGLFAIGITGLNETDSDGNANIKNVVNVFKNADYEWTVEGVTSFIKDLTNTGIGLPFSVNGNFTLGYTFGIRLTWGSSFDCQRRCSGGRVHLGRNTFEVKWIINSNTSTSVGILWVWFWL